MLNGKKKNKAPAGLEKKVTFTFNRGAKEESTLCSLYEGITREQGLSKEENDKEAAEGLQAVVRSLIQDKTGRSTATAVCPPVDQK